MNDTSQSMLEKQRKIIFSKTPQERAAMAVDMVDLIYYMIREQIEQENPNLTKNEITAKVFLRYYSDDFSDVEKERIVKSIKSE
ncbi:MAG: hypothetical protein FH748_05610 [Balneolaceae bacterium]|nr:hypothetical protein [Balneolaceae bacterium]